MTARVLCDVEKHMTNTDWHQWCYTTPWWVLITDDGAVARILNPDVYPSLGPWAVRLIDHDDVETVRLPPDLSLDEVKDIAQALALSRRDT